MYTLGRGKGLTSTAAPEAFCYHYTSRFAAQSIISTGTLSAGRLGKTWLTPDLYANGADAANCLEIADKVVEVRVRIPAHLVNSPSSTSRVLEVVFGGVVVRHGLGNEFTTPVNIDASGLEWSSLEAP